MKPQYTFEKVSSPVEHYQVRLKGEYVTHLVKVDDKYICSQMPQIIARTDPSQVVDDFLLLSGYKGREDFIECMQQDYLELLGRLK